MITTTIHRLPGGTPRLPTTPAYFLGRHSDRYLARYLGSAARRSPGR